jgi:hypothetical protein
MPKLEWKLLTKKRGSSTQGIPPGKEAQPTSSQERNTDRPRQ